MTPDKNGWFPINTAPLGREVVWLWFPDAQRATEGFVYAYGDGGIGSSSAFRGMEPSHWQPLPKPPVEAA